MKLAILIFLSLLTVFTIQQKLSWPEWVNRSAYATRSAIRHENPNVQPVIIPKGVLLTKEYNPKRVRILINKRGMVTDVPVVG